MEKYRQMSTGGLDEAQVAAALDGAGAGTVATGKLIKVSHGMSISQGVTTLLEELEASPSGTVTLVAHAVQIAKAVTIVQALLNRSPGAPAASATSVSAEPGKDMTPTPAGEEAPAADAAALAEDSPATSSPVVKEEDAGKAPLSCITVPVSLNLTSTYTPRDAEAGLDNIQVVSPAVSVILLVGRGLNPKAIGYGVAGGGVSIGADILQAMDGESRPTRNRMRAADGTRGGARGGRGPAANSDACGVFRASGTIVVSPGFLSVYSDTFGAPAVDTEEDSEGSDAGLPSAAVSPSAMSARPGTSTAAAQELPDVVPGEPVAVTSLDIVEHTTTPPARYTDASLVKELEALGVGRPSTYASIVETLVLRGYVSRGTRETAGRLPPQALAPRLTAFVVDQLLRRYFPSFVDAAFTAEMERSLDAIAAGAADRQEYLSSYYLGAEGLAASVARMEKEIDTAWARRLVLPTAGSGAPAGRGTQAGAETKRQKGGDGGGLAAGAEVFVGPYGPYIELPRDVMDAAAGGVSDGSREVIKASLPAATLADDLSADRLEQIVARALDPVIGTDPASGLPVLVRTGRYGPYVQLGRDEDWVPEEKPKRKSTKKAAAAAAETDAAAAKAAPAADASGSSSPALSADGKRIGKPKRASLLSGMDVGDVTLPTALRILSLPRLLGTHPTLGGEVKAGMGRFGPYIVHEGVFVSLKPSATAPVTAGGSAGDTGGAADKEDAPSAAAAAADGPTPDATAADDGGPAAAGDPDQWRQVLTVGLDEAVALLDRPRSPRRAYAADKAKRVKASA